MSEINVAEFKLLCSNMQEQQAICEGLTLQLGEATDKLNNMKGVILSYLEKYNLKNFDFGSGKVIAVDKFSVSVADKYALADYLRAQGKFDDLFTFNYQTVNSFYKEEMEKAIETGNVDFKVTGLSEPKYFKYLQVRSK